MSGMAGAGPARNIGAPARRGVGWPSGNRSGTASPHPSGFASVFEEALRFSRHARERMDRSSGVLSTDDLSRLEEGVRRAAIKGAREAVVIMPGWAFIVSVPDRTVITAIEEGRMAERVFTGIDAAVWVDGRSAGSRASSEGACPQRDEYAGRLMSV